MYSNLICLLFVNVRKYIKSTTRHLNLTYISVLTNLLRTVCIYKLYSEINCTVNMGLIVSDKSVSPTNFRRGRFQGNLFLFEKHKWLQKIFI